MDSTYEQLAERNAELEQDKARLADEVERLRKGITKARLFAGERLPAGPGLTVVSMLEKAMKGEE